MPALLSLFAAAESSVLVLPVAMTASQSLCSLCGNGLGGSGGGWGEWQAGSGEAQGTGILPSSGRHPTIETLATPSLPPHPHAQPQREAGALAPTRLVKTLNPGQKWSSLIFVGL